MGLFGVASFVNDPINKHQIFPEKIQFRPGMLHRSQRWETREPAYNLGINKNRRIMSKNQHNFFNIFRSFKFFISIYLNIKCIIKFISKKKMK